MSEKTASVKGRSTAQMFDAGQLRWMPFPGGKEQSAARRPLPVREMMAVFDSLPPGVGKTALRRTAQAVLAAAAEKRAAIWAVDGSMPRASLVPVLLDLIERDLVTCVCLDGDAARADVEVALFGQTAVPPQAGDACLWEEIGKLWASAAERARARRLGLGRALGELIEQQHARFRDDSILAACERKGIAATVHYVPGTLGLELHPLLSANDFGDAALLDFRTFVQATVGLEGGVWLHGADFMPLGRLLCKALALLQHISLACQRMTCVFLGLEPRRAANEELRTALAVERFPNRKIYHLPGSPEFVLPLLRGAVLREAGVADVYRDL